MWRSLDYNGNNIVSLAEIDKWVGEKYPVLDNASALRRAYYRTTLKDGDGDAYVETFEFRALLNNLLWFNKLYDMFESVDTDNDER